MGGEAPVPPVEGVAVRAMLAVHGHARAAAELTAALTPRERAGVDPLPDPLCRRLPSVEAYRACLAPLSAAGRRLLLLAAADQHPVESRAFLRAVAAAGYDTADLTPAQDAGLLWSTAAGIEFCDPLLRAVVYDSARPEERRASHQLLARVLDARTERLPWNWHRACASLGPSRRLARDLAATPVADHRLAAHRAERAALLSPDSAGRLADLASAALHAWRGGRSDHARRLLAAAQSIAPAAAGRDPRISLLRGIVALRCGHAPAAYDDLADAAASAVAVPGAAASGAAASGAATSYAAAPLAPAFATYALAHAAEVGHYTGDLRRCQQAARLAAALSGRHPPPSAPADRALLAGLAGVAASARGGYAEAVVRLREAVMLARQSDDPTALVHATMAALYLGDDDHALAASHQAEAAARAQGALSALPQALEFRAYAEAWSGRLDAATTTAVHALRLAQETGQDNIACHVRAGMALLAAVRGDTGACLAHARSAQSHAAEHGIGLATALSLWALAYLDLTMGRPAEAVSRLRALARLGPGHGHPAIRRITTPHYVEAAVRTGDKAAAAAALSGYEQWAATVASPGHLALAARCRALLCSGEQALDHYREALDLHDADGRHLERGRTELLYGIALRRMRRRPEARDRLRAAHQAFEQFGAQPSARQAAAELRAMGCPVAGPADTSGETPAGVPGIQNLTAQQALIAKMVADGATNREIAARLVLSPRTVDHHLRGIYARLGICSRVELARLVDV
ncbi:helix-turn-helix transcriptional regulator [Streptomyces vilmorinianum]|uniref:helix-turn-helix transcriptional regulator n=1 Tax=Streptomyces vilmorinianum TaxID=3051092 RepID=UPI0010FBBD99|nr:LuxR family transcriptional regulator [Streptomyces vilmorinianum]